MRRLLILLIGALALLSFATNANVFAQQSSNTSASSVPSNEDIEGTRQQLMRLLRITPRLTSVVARDPSLLADAGYVGANNPALGEFLRHHPEVVRNPEFYLFANVGGDHGRREDRLQREVWPELDQREREPFLKGTDVLVFLVFLSLLGSLLWLIWIFVGNRRWTRIFAQQSEAQNKLLDKFAASQELLAYLQLEPGKRLWEPGAAAVNAGGGLFSRPVALPAVAPLQFGIVFVMVGIGFLWLAAKGIADIAPLTIFGILSLMLGIGLILSAIASGVMARHFGLLPAKVMAAGENGSSRLMD